MGYLTNEQNNKAFTQEIRLTGEGNRPHKLDSWCLLRQKRGVLGFLTYVDDYRNSPAFEAWSYYYPGLAPTDVWWNSFQGTDRTDKAVFGEIDIELIENK